MNTIEIIITGIALATDAFAVSISKGLSKRKILIKDYIIIGLYLSIAQAIMPIFGYLIGNTFETFIKEIAHWVSVTLLTIIGISMIKESNENISNDIDAKSMLPLSIATSIDAMIVGITFSLNKTSLLKAILIIGIITFILSIIGVKIGYTIGSKYEKKSQILGGIILICIGIKIYISNL